MGGCSISQSVPAVSSKLDALNPTSRKRAAFTLHIVIKELWIKVDIWIKLIGYSDGLAVFELCHNRSSSAIGL